MPRRSTADRANPVKQRRSQETLDRLLDAAEHRLGRVGAEGATLRAIADQAGVSVGIVYRRFPDKDTVLRATYMRFFERAVAANEAVPAITGEAKLALDSGNRLFRAKVYDEALAQYQRSAVLAPTALAPLLGIMMVADVTKDAKLTEATLPRIRKLNPALADSSTAMSHSKMIEAHPRTGTSAPPP